MFETLNNPGEERGQVGIGTLIVFIALVLVAAIAAGVLINTAGFLQNQAESTGQESSDQVTDSVQVIGATGDVNAGEVDNVSLTVSLSPGADPVDLTDATLQYVNSTASTNDIGDDGSSSDVHANGVGDAGTTLSDSDERAKIYIDVGAVDSTLKPGNEAEVVIITESGSQTTEVLNVPDPIGDKSAVIL